MANNGLSPPPFREALVERTPLTMVDTWQRWLDAFWQQQSTLWKQAQEGQKPLVGGTGEANKVGIWSDATTLTSDTLLHYDSTQHWLGIGTTPATPLHVVAAASAAAGAATGILRVEETASNLRLASHAYWESTVGMNVLAISCPGALGSVTKVGGVSVDDFPAVPAGGQALAFYGGVSAGTNRWNLFMGGSAPNYLAGRLGIGTATPRWGLEVQTSAIIDRLGVWVAPPTTVHLSTQYASIDRISLGRGDVTPRYQLDGEGQWGWLASLGLGALAPTGMALRVGGQAYFGANVGIGYEPDASYWLKAGSTQIDSLAVSGSAYCASSMGIGYQPPVGISLRCGMAQFDHSGFVGGVDARFVARFYSTIYCDGVPYTSAGGPWSAFSDRRLKRNIQPIPHPLDTMTALHGVLYEYTDTDMGKPAGLRMGVIAQEVEDVLPEWVGELDGYKTTQLSQFEGLCIEAVKELTQRVAALEERGAWQ